MFSELAEYRATDLLADHHKLKSYITKGFAVEKQQNAELRSELKGISKQMKADYTMFVTRIKEEIRNFTNDVSDKLTSLVSEERFNNVSAFVTTTQSEFRNETRQSLITLKSDVETSLQKLYNDFQTLNQTEMANAEHCNNVSDSLTMMTNERLNNLSAFVTEKQSELKNETRQSLISLMSDVETSIQKLSNDLQTVNQTTVENVERCNNASDSLKKGTDERLNNLTAFVNMTRSELRTEARQSMISLKSGVEKYIQKLSNDLQTVNQNTMENVKHWNNVSDYLREVTNERLNNLTAFINMTRSELRTEARQSMITLKYDVETSIQKLSNDLQTVNQSTMENVERCNNTSDSLKNGTDERLNNLTIFVNMSHSELRNEARQSMISLKSDVETSIQKLSNDLQTVNQSTTDNFERCNKARDTLTIVTNERLNNLTAFVTTTQSELRNEARKSLISLKFDVETSIQKLSTDVYTVNLTAVKSVERCNNVSDSLTIVTNERLNNLSAFVTTRQSELQNEGRQSAILLKSVETSILKLSIDYLTLNQTAMKNVESCYNVSDSMAKLTNERLNNLSAFVSARQSELRNETRQLLFSIKSDVETSIQRLSSWFRTVNQTAMKNDERCDNVTDALTIVTSDIHTVNKILKMMYLESCKNAPKSGAYLMYFAKSATPLRAYCDQTTDGGGWLVIQRRKDGSVDFERTWADYKTGFGDIEGEFWIGNNNLYALTSAGLNELRIDMEDFEGNQAYAKYSNFKLHPESELYRLEVSGYSGNAGNSLRGHNWAAFSTKDRDNDNWYDNCSLRYRGGWWYYWCLHSNLNGYYYRGGNSPGGSGIIWEDWKGYDYSLKTVEIKIR